MMRFPSKLYGISESVIGDMMQLMEIIPDGGESIVNLSLKTAEIMTISDFIDALDCMYAIGTIKMSKDYIIEKVC